MNAILGAVSGLEIEYISPFLLSLSRTGFDGNVFFFVTKTSERTRNLLEKYGVRLITVDESTMGVAPPINSFRYFIYEQFFAQCGDDYANFMVADVRDVYFQRDPFDFEMGDSLCCFLEDREVTLSKCPVNSGWLAAAYGNEVLREVAEKPVSCSGTTIGPMASMRAYVNAMASALRAADERVTNIMHAIHGVDQAVHNYLVHTGKLETLRLFKNEDGPILTLNYVPADEVVYNDDGDVVNQAGDVVHVLHQYDRHPALTERVLRRINGGGE